MRNGPPTLRGDSRHPAATLADVRGISKWAILTLVAIGSFMTTVDSSIVIISLPAIARSFGAPLAGTIEWVVIAYLLVIATVLLTFGRLSDMIGRKPIFAAGLAIFTLGSGFSGAAPSLSILIVARAIQGLGGALIFAPSVALITDAFPPSEHGKAIGLNAIAVALGISTGPTLGGLITEHLTWHWIFYVNLPVGVAGLIATLRILPTTRHAPQRFDPLGAILLGLGLGATTLGLSFGSEWGWTSPQLIATVAVGIVGLVLLIIVEQRIESPTIHLALFRDRVFASAMVSLVLTFLALFAVSFLMPFYLEDLRGFSTQKSGLLLTPMSLVLGVIGPFSGALADRFGSRWLTAGGLTIACVGLVTLTQLDVNTSIVGIIWRLALTGSGIALFQTPNNRALMTAAPRSEQGEASGLLATGRVVGQSVSVAFAGAVFAIMGGSEAANALVIAQEAGRTLPPDQLMVLQQTFVLAFRYALFASAIVAAVGILTSLVRGHEDGVGEAAGHEAAGHEAAGHEAAGHEAAGHEAAGHEAAGHEAAGHEAAGPEDGAGATADRAPRESARPHHPRPDGRKPG
ncbi:MAG: DHA2 family efflux MFS transporter permease subunit [Chloroflexi bacterium]|nr:DHA2 family efflux MFS transporter permease subunit [Chloroflexota bacterium]